MIVQLSSGQGPSECELAVKKLFDSLSREFPDIELLSSHAAKEAGCFSSILFSTECDLSHLEGSIQWICKSPFRPNHKRKNWFVDVSIIPEVENICTEHDIRFERFHCGGKGGQRQGRKQQSQRAHYAKKTFEVAIHGGQYAKQFLHNIASFLSGTPVRTTF